MYLTVGRVFYLTHMKPWIAFPPLKSGMVEPACNRSSQPIAGRGKRIILGRISSCKPAWTPRLPAPCLFKPLFTSYCVCGVFLEMFQTRSLPRVIYV